MITLYHRPETLEEALKLLTQPSTIPLGGGTLLSQPTPDPVNVVDLQRLNLDSLTKSGNDIHLGATVTLQLLLESEHCPKAMKQALRLEAPLNLRNSATAAGTLVACDGRTPFVTVLMALDARVEQAFLNGSNIETRATSIGEFLPLRPKGLITKIIFPSKVDLAFEYVSRTPSDMPIVCAALAGWGSSRRRLALGGYGKSPMLAMDGTSSDDLAAAARNAYHEANDEFGSAEYRMDVAATLAQRCAKSLA